MYWTAVEIARATWTEITEPGDMSAAKLIKAVGPERGLEIAQGSGLTFDEKDRLQGWFTQAELDTALPRWGGRTEAVTTRTAHHLAMLENMGGYLLTPEAENWPVQLDELSPPPIALWMRGRGDMPQFEQMISIIGSRDATEYGLSITNEIASGLRNRGFVIVSGGAYGIDAAAHRGAMASWYDGDPTPTVAVLASGVDRYYPEGNRDLLDDVAAKGLVISEVPPGTAPSRYRFLNRNRIIAALSVGTLVVEARWRSGALNTATHACVLHRALAAVPGSVTSFNSMGTHRLIREGSATLVNDAAEMVELVTNGKA